MTQYKGFDDNPKNRDYFENVKYIFEQNSRGQCLDWMENHLGDCEISDDMQENADYWRDVAKHYHEDERAKYEEIAQLFEIIAKKKETRRLK